MTVTVTRHPHTGWQESALGESTAPLFGPDETVTALAYEPGGASEPTLGVDSVAAVSPRLLLRGDTPQWSEHDEWTVNGERYLVAGRPSRWLNPFTGRPMGTVVALARRTG